MSDLVKRLREQSRRGYWPLLGDEAADRIEALEAALRQARDDLEAAYVNDGGYHAWKDQIRSGMNAINDLLNDTPEKQK
jgi:uncharacterized protein YukE